MHRADRFEHRHRRAVHRPHPHHHQCRAAQLIAHPIEPRVLFLFAHEAFDLANAGKIVVQERVHRRSSATLQSITSMRGQGVSQRAGDQKRERHQREQGQLSVQIKHHADDDDHLQDRDHALLDSVDQARARLNSHLPDHARHQIAGGAIVEPAQRQQLNVRIKIAAQIENNFLLEGVVQNNAQRVERVLKQKRHEREQNERQQFLRMMSAERRRR